METKKFEQIIKNNYEMITKMKVPYPQACAGIMRTALEAIVKLFYQNKYGEVYEPFNIFDAVEDERFRKFFNEKIISDIHFVRKICNDSLHEGSDVSIATIGNMLNRIENIAEGV